MQTSVFDGNPNYQLELSQTITAYNATTGVFTVENVAGIRQLGGANIAGTADVEAGNGWSGYQGTVSYNFAGYDYIEIMRWSRTHGPTFGDGSPDETYPVARCVVLVERVSGGALGEAQVTSNIAPPGTPPATIPVLDPVEVVAGQQMTILLPRAQPQYTHVLSYAVGFEGVPRSPIAKDVGDSYTWNVPAALYAASRGTGGNALPVKVWVATYDGATKLGDRVAFASLLPPTALEPTVTSFAAVDENTAVASIVGKYVQSLSRLRLTNVTATPKPGAEIVEGRLAIEGAEMKIGDVRPLVNAGTIPVTAIARDTRGVQGSLPGSIPVLAYAPPGPLVVSAHRTDAAGVAASAGNRLAVTIGAAVKSLINGTERNAITSILVHSRERGTTDWTLRNTLTPAGLSYVGTVPVGSLATVFAPEKSWEIRVTLADRFRDAIAATTVAQGGVAIHLKGTAVGIGKEHQQGALDVAGDVYTPAGKLTPADADTGWVDLSAYLLSGFSGTILARKIGSFVDITSTNITGPFPSANVPTDFLSGLPAMWRPTGGNRWGSVYSAGFPGAVCVRPAGTMGVTNRTGTAWTYAQISVSYIAG